MRKVIFPIAFIATSTLLACSFQMKAGSDPQHPAPPPPPGQPGQPAQPATPGQPAPHTTLTTFKHLGKPAPKPSTTNTTPTPTPTAAPTGAPIITGNTIFGHGGPDMSGFKGAIYWIPAGTTTMPAVASMQPSGFLFSANLNVTAQTFTGGFPGVDAAHSTNFAIRYEAPLIVAADADYTFRLVSDDGSNLLIDNTPIVANDGVKSAPTPASGPVHLVAGTHLLTVDYFETTGPVALQLYCTKAGGAEQICPLTL